VIDRVHLSRMTLGDRNLEAEVLRLFVRQCAVLLQRIREAPPESAAAFAHTLKGSCRGVGAWQMAQAAEQVETAARASDRNGLDASLEQLAAAVAQMRAAMSYLLESQS
jgi:HPt (histidine-containing phosphotransfer) domain-containing protein